MPRLTRDFVCVSCLVTVRHLRRFLCHALGTAAEDAPRFALYAPTAAAAAAVPPPPPGAHHASDLSHVTDLETSLHEIVTGGALDASPRALALYFRYDAAGDAAAARGA